jgi:hypothetical protein
MHTSRTAKAASMAIVAVGCAGIWASACGGSSKGSSSSSPDFACQVSVVDQQYCYAYSNLTPETVNTARSMCSSQQGKAVDSCPTEGLVGCCALTQSGISMQSCYYFGTASADEMACSAANGKWTPGSGALGGGGGKGGGSGGGSGGGRGGASGSGGSGGAGSTGTSACTGSGMCCPEGYCTIGSAHGYEFEYSDRNDGGGSSAQLTESSCVTGSIVGIDCASQSSPQTCYSTHWGAGIGFNLNQATGEDSTPANFTSAGSSGVTYAIEPLYPNMRLVVGDSKTDYCVALTSPSGTIPWSTFSSSCWNTTGSRLSGPPASFVSVRFQVVADTSYAGFSSFDFCVTRLSL